MAMVETVNLVYLLLFDMVAFCTFVCFKNVTNSLDNKPISNLKVIFTALITRAFFFGEAPGRFYDE